MSNDQLTIGVHVPAEGIARVIGKGGAGLKKIRESCGCKLQVDEGADVSQKRRVSITGSVPGLGSALQQTLLKAFQDDLTSITVTVMIPAEVAGQVVGKAGNNLQRVRDSYGVRLDLERAPIVDPAFGTERTLTMSGSAMVMGQALCMALTGVGSAVHPSQIPAAFQVGAGVHSNVGAIGVSGLDIRQASDDPEELQLHMAVPGSLVGAILGREGQNIKQTGTSSGCKISVTKKDAGERRVVIIGKYAQCQAAQALLQQQLEAAAQSAEGDVDVSTTCITYYVRKSAAGAVIGKGGNTLRQVREETGTKIQFDRDEIHGQRPCTISGEGSQVMQAISKIFDIVSQEQEPEDAGLEEPPGAKRMANKIGAAASGNGLKRQRLEGENGSTKLLVPARSVGSVIGKQGSGLARIRESCGVKVEVLQPGQAPQWPELRVVILQGSFHCREAAVKTVLEAIQVDGAFSTLKMLVLKSEAGAVIGKAGRTLKMIRETTGISVQVDKQDVLGERLVSAEGPLDSIVSVAQWVMWSVNGDDRQEGIGMLQDDLPAPVPTRHDTIPPTPSFAAKDGYSWQNW